MDEDRKKEQIRSASKFSVEKKSSVLRLYFNHENRCLVSTWAELAQKIGLSQADVPELQKLVMMKGLKGPRR